MGRRHCQVGSMSIAANALPVVGDLLGRRAQVSAESVALVEGLDGPSVTFGEWNARVNRTAAYLADLGVSKGDRVTVYSKNRPEYLDLFWAANKLGFVLHNLNWRLTVQELRHFISDAQPVVFLYGNEWSEQTDQLRQLLDSVRHVVAFDERDSKDRSFEERASYPSSSLPNMSLDPDDIWGIYYTGGTTGLPKGASLTSGNIVWGSLSTIVTWGLTGEHTAPLQLPLFHVGGPNIFMVPLALVGGTTILCEEFDVNETFDLLERGKITHYVAVPTMFQMLQSHPRWEDADFSKLELVISGGAPCPLPVMEKFWDRGVKFRTGYGLTEATGNSFWLPHGEWRENPTSIGVPLSFVEARVVDEFGSEVGDGVVGELLIRGPHVMTGYWGQPEASAQVLRDGWLHTGDLAMRDSSGLFAIKGRSKEMFISGGENVYPAEIEAAMLAYNHVAEAAVAGIPHVQWGEVGVAWVVVRPGATYSEHDFRDFLGQRLARYKIPQEITVIEALPKTAIGKADKQRLLESRNSASDARPEDAGSR